MEIQGFIQNLQENYLPLPNACFEELQACAKFLLCSKEDILVREGQVSDQIYYIHQGSARAYYLKDGKDITDWFAFEGSFIVSINSFFKNEPSLHYIEVLEDSLLFSLARKDFEALSAKYIEFERLEKLVITRTMLQLQERIVSMQFYSARLRFENLRKQIPGIEQRVPLTHIASYLGITLETLSRIRRPKNEI